MIDPSVFRQALGHFATGVTVVTTRTAMGEPIGVTASSFNSVSLDPPLVLWSIGRKAFSYPAFATAEHFAVHVLGDGHADWSNRFGRASGAKFEGLDYGEGLGAVPLLVGCPARFECRVEHRYEGGDHLIMVGRVLRLEQGGDEARPLLFHRGRYAGLGIPSAE
ncbi:flavin reductase family protein [Pseudomonas saudiphocaensis]|uniref:flavin reductase family protein n=1 Tax=Pseudomonas saudiphocaensis TaxID=1499686 RepID=UPI00187D5A73|nr:flavin reductase family protein [Pseudomonas saudiphocaensis]MBE7928889.1 flavin reductase family protein [Pseudomonas saudiphocaensis]